MPELTHESSKRRARAKRRWALREGDLPSEEILRREPRLRGVEENAAYRWMRWRWESVVQQELTLLRGLLVVIGLIFVGGGPIYRLMIAHDMQDEVIIISRGLTWLGCVLAVASLLPFALGGVAGAVRRDASAGILKLLLHDLHLAGTSPRELTEAALALLVGADIPKRRVLHWALFALSLLILAAPPTYEAALIARMGLPPFIFGITNSLSQLSHEPHVFLGQLAWEMKRGMSRFRAGRSGILVSFREFILFFAKGHLPMAATCLGAYMVSSYLLKLLDPPAVNPWGYYIFESRVPLFLFPAGLICAAVGALFGVAIGRIRRATAPRNFARVEGMFAEIMDAAIESESATRPERRTL